MNQDAILAALVFVPILTAIIQVIKAAVKSLPSDLIPLIAIGLGVGYTVGGAAWGPAGVDVTADYFTQVIAGLVLGLASSGFYEAGSVGISRATIPKEPPG